MSESTALALTIDMVPRLPAKVGISAETKELITQSVAKANAISTITTQEEYNAAEVALKEVTSLSNRIDKQRQSFTAPLTALAKTAKSEADDARVPLELAKDALKKKMVAHLNEEKRKQEEALAAAVAEQERREREAREIAEKAKANPFAVAIGTLPPPESVVIPTPHVTLEVAKPVATKGSAIIETWLWSVEDKAQIPAEFFILDEKRINAMVREHKGSLTIPGIRVYSETNVRAR